MGNIAAKLIAPLLGFACALPAVPAAAAPVILSGSGTVTRVTASTAPGLVGVPTGTVAAGDTLTFRFTFDPLATNRIFDGGAGFQVLGFSASNISIRVGSYVFQPESIASSPPVLLLGTGFRLFPPNAVSEPVFNQDFFFPGSAGGNPPFVLTPDGGATFSLSSVFRTDLGGRTPTGADLRDPASAASNRFSFVFGSGAGLVGQVEGTFTAGIATAAVPEPASWAMLITGFGIIGAALRRSRRASVPARLAQAG